MKKYSTIRYYLPYYLYIIFRFQLLQNNRSFLLFDLNFLRIIKLTHLVCIISLTPILIIKRSQKSSFNFYFKFQISRLIINQNKVDMQHRKQAKNLNYGSTPYQRDESSESFASNPTELLIHGSFEHHQQNNIVQSNTVQTLQSSIHNTRWALSQESSLNNFNKDHNLAQDSLVQNLFENMAQNNSVGLINVKKPKKYNRREKIRHGDGTKKQKKIISKEQKLKRNVRKNSLQFFSGKIWECFHQKDANFYLDPQRQKYLDQMRKNPTLKNFDIIFKQSGVIRQRLANFFSRTQLSRTILLSKVRKYQAKIAIKTIGQVLKKSFINSRCPILSTSTNKVETLSNLQFHME